MTPGPAPRPAGTASREPARAQASNEPNVASEKEGWADRELSVGQGVPAHRAGLSLPVTDQRAFGVPSPQDSVTLFHSVLSSPAQHPPHAHGGRRLPSTLETPAPSQATQLPETGPCLVPLPCPLDEAPAGPPETAPG